MRFTVFLLMFAVSLVAWECAAETAQQTGELIKDQEQPDSTGITTTTAQQAPAPEHLPALVPEPVPEQVPQEVPEQAHVSPEGPQARASPDVGEISTITAAPPKIDLHPEKTNGGQQDNQEDQLQQQQQQQQDHSRNSNPDRTQGGVQTEMRTGGDIQLAPNTPSSSTGGHATQNAEDKTPNTPGSPPKPPTDSQAPQSPTSVRNVNTQTPTTTIIRHTASHPPEQDQHHASQQSQTSPAGSNPVPPKKPTPTSTPAADNAVHQTAANTGDKKTHTEHTSVSSTSEPVKGESTLPATTSEKLSKAMKALDNKDSSISSLSLFALTTLSTLIVMAFAPAS